MAKNLDNLGLSSIVENYQLFYIDLWGVIHNGISLHNEAIKTLKEITKKKKEYVLLTNAPRPNEAVKNFLETICYLHNVQVFSLFFSLLYNTTGCQICQALHV